MTAATTTRTATGLYLTVEVVGCPTVCLHCWAQGLPYPAMPLADVAWVLEEAHRFADAAGLPFDAYPMHEVAAHPQTGGVLRQFFAHRGGRQFEPLATTGVPLALRDDWRDVLASAAAVGTRQLVFAFHGVGADHDRQVGRPGAYEQSRLAVARAQEAGFGALANVFVTTATLPRLEELAGALGEMGFRSGGLYWEPANFYPTARGRRNERLRPTLTDLQPVAGRIAELGKSHRERWLRLDEHTEAAHARRALAGAWPAPPDAPATGPALVVRPDLDLYAGTAGRYRARLGNLRADGVAPLLRRALAGDWYAGDALWFDLDPVPPVAELAATSRRRHR